MHNNANTVRRARKGDGKPMVMIFFDPRSTRSYIRQEILSAGTTPKVHREELNGESKTNLSTELRNVIFLEFARSLRLEKNVNCGFLIG